MTNYNIKVFLFVENNIVIPDEELFRIKETTGTPYEEWIVQNLKYELIHSLTNELLQDPKKFFERKLGMCG